MKKYCVRIVVTFLALTMILCLSACGATKATVQTAEGSETLSVSEICKFSSRYENRSITVTGRVKRVDGPKINQDAVPYFYYYDVELDGGWQVLVSKDSPIIDSLNIGDTITARGYIMDAHVFVTICGKQNGLWNANGTSVSIS